MPERITPEADGQANAPGDIILVGNDDQARIHFIRFKVAKVAGLLAQRAMKSTPDLTDESQNPTNSDLYWRLVGFLQWLANVMEMTPRVAEESNIKRTMEVLTNEEKYHFPTDIVQSAKKLLEKWQGENWGNNDEVKEEVRESDSENEGEAPTVPLAKRRKLSAQAPNRAKVEAISFRGPPKSHPIFGVNGIMHGAVCKPGRRRAFILDPRYPKRNPKAFGHNGLKPGQWWPQQIVALFNGAHGATVGGISGTVSEGAWSVVVSGMYEDLDRDEGDIIYYSGSGSHENQDPKNPPKSTSGTQALHASLESARPVRVLRSSKGRGRFVPTAGLRYDGLYCVVGYETPINMLGGQYERFQLRRLPNQIPLEQIRGTSPTASQLKDYHRIGEGY